MLLFFCQNCASKSRYTSLDGFCPVDKRIMKCARVQSFIPLVISGLVAASTVAAPVIGEETRNGAATLSSNSR